MRHIERDGSPGARVLFTDAASFVPVDFNALPDGSSFSLDCFFEEFI